MKNRKEKPGRMKKFILPVERLKDRKLSAGQFLSTVMVFSVWKKFKKRVSTKNKAKIKINSFLLSFRFDSFSIIR
jgi:hypothetical protein